jgi:hypothetical protein
MDCLLVVLCSAQKFFTHGDVTDCKIYASLRRSGPLSRKESISCQTCYDTGPRFFGLVWRTLFSRLLRLTRGGWGPIQTQIYTGYWKYMLELLHTLTSTLTTVEKHSLIGNIHSLEFYHSDCEDQRKTAFIILPHTHGYWKIDAHNIYIERKSVELLCENSNVLVNLT